MLTHMHISGVYLVVLAYLQRRWSLRGREGFGILSPSRELGRRDSTLSRKWKTYFPLCQRKVLAKLRECFSLRNTHQTLGQTALDAEAAFDEDIARGQISSVRWSIQRSGVGASDTHTIAVGFRCWTCRTLGCIRCLFVGRIWCKLGGFQISLVAFGMSRSVQRLASDVSNACSRGLLTL